MNAESDALMQQIYLAVPFAEKDTAKEAGARWDKDKKIWYVEAANIGKTISEETIKKWLPNKDVAQGAQQKQALRPEEEFAAEIRAAGLILDGEPIMDGKFHRVPVEGGKRGAKDGAYVGFLDGKPSGHIENFKSGLKLAWTSQSASLSPEEMAHLKAEFEAARIKREQETAERQNAVADASDKKFNEMSQEIPGGTYLERKQIGAHGVRFEDNTVVVPARDINGKIWTLQRIPVENGALKLFEKGGKKTGNMHIIGDIESGDVVLVAEGYATGASIYEASGKTVVVAFDAGNLDPVIERLKERYPNKALIIMGDDDRSKEVNVGRMRAEQAAEKHNVGVSFPYFSTDDKKLSDFNDLHVTEGMEKVRNQVLATIDKYRSHAQKTYEFVSGSTANSTNEELHVRDATSSTDSSAEMVSDLNKKELTMAATTETEISKKNQQPPLILRGVSKLDNGAFDTTVLLFKGKGDYLQGYVKIGDKKHHVLAHINERKPNEGTGEVKPNFIKLSEPIGDGANKTWKEIGFGNAVNKRKDGEPVFYDEVLFSIGNEVLKARVTKHVDEQLHRQLGFQEARKARPDNENKSTATPLDASQKPPAPAATTMVETDEAPKKKRRNSTAKVANA